MRVHVALRNKLRGAITYAVSGELSDAVLIDEGDVVFAIVDDEIAHGQPCCCMAVVALGAAVGCAAAGGGKFCVDAGRVNVGFVHGVGALW